MHLGYRTIDTPTCAHFAPVQDEFLFDRRERHNYFCYFCRYRIYRTNSTLTRPLSIRLVKANDDFALSAIPKLGRKGPLPAQDGNGVLNVGQRSLAIPKTPVERN